MNQLISPFELSRFIDKKGFEVIPIKQDNNLYKCVVWNKEKCLGLGKYEYKEWHDAVNKTSLKIYEKLK